MLDAARELLATGASAPEVEKALYRRQADGQLRDMPVPSPSTIKSLAREMAPDDSPTWTLEDSGPAEAPLVLRVLKAVVHETKGRVRHLTRREAHLAAVHLASRPGIEGSNPHRQAWTAYAHARTYLAMLGRGDDPADAHLEIAIQAEIEGGLVYRPGMIDPMLKEDVTRG